MYGMKNYTLFLHCFLVVTHLHSLEQCLLFVLQMQPERFSVDLVEHVDLQEQDIDSAYRKKSTNYAKSV